ncbi:uncharacterized protein LOC124285747 [Haliotis rubra]|uniref:uncharacterized protein LOC124285747 n=1 Tax=Haliotis rubra TaxID=36100 RepID=UPI001EE5ABB3|nr:uncharacterized protein LOC124285747 [Haliotis rubra]
MIFRGSRITQGGLQIRTSWHLTCGPHHVRLKKPFSIDKTTQRTEAELSIHKLLYTSNLLSANYSQLKLSCLIDYSSVCCRYEGVFSEPNDSNWHSQSRDSYWEDLAESTKVS